MTTPPYTAEEARDRETFLALMWSLSYPTRPHRLPVGDPLHLIGHALLDLETSFYTPDIALMQALHRTGARATQPPNAAYHFYPRLDDATLRTIDEASVGSLSYPDTAATLIIATSFSGGAAYRLRGPGIQGSVVIAPALPRAFWEQRARATFPLGWDVFLVEDSRVIGLPRSARAEEV
ncbi:phosphonate C-P lyase system protein PhnH [Fischerella thermalis CCMEE 5330]|uniref:Phosphonate C-P lyase system protein PhnH n=1 Tax=Fischerella thermalis CCMEE 5330 TaxID=2019670 RepID=A0A2N6MNT2_9CYAN|nr:phosphonate C-P lyase system protein PhnH [Fischerella thermalis CCMEE 5330]